MNMEQILAMMPSRELDALVAEKIMELDVTWYSPNKIDNVPQYDNGSRDVPKYSTDLTAAWEIVEELQKSHLYVDIRTCADFYEVWVTRWETGQVTCTVAYPSLPRAICKAALIAVEMEEVTEQ